MKQQEKRVLTEYGKRVRKHRIDADMTLQSMADDVGVTAAYLSAVERGKKRVSADIVERVAASLGLSAPQRADLHCVAELSNPRITVPLTHLSLTGRSTVALLVRHLDSLSDTDFQQIDTIVRKAQ